MNVIPLIDFENDEWVIPSREDLSDYRFSFGFIPNENLKQTIKKIIFESLTINKLSDSTIHRYHYSLKFFFKFLNETHTFLETFADVTPKMIEQFIFYLLLNIDSPSTRTVKMAALKYFIKYGQILEWENFPSRDIFDGTERRTLQTADILKSMVIEDPIMKQIDMALLNFREEMKSINEVCTWGLITLIRHTGLRLHEALRINGNHLTRDLMGKYLLEVCSDKNLTDRYIPVNKEVANAIKMVSKATKEARAKLNTERIFIKFVSRGQKFNHLSQYNARYYLKSFMKRNLIDPTITYHQFRHTIGTHLLNNGMSIPEVMHYLGHESNHSTRHYAKVQNDKLSKDYRRLGFIGIVVDKANNVTDNRGDKIDNKKRLMAQLPDGICARSIKEQVINCKKPNACLFCPKFITTPEFLDFHKEHLERIKADEERYLEENLIGTDYLLFETKQALKEIISRLESISQEKEGTV